MRPTIKPQTDFASHYSVLYTSADEPANDGTHTRTRGVSYLHTYCPRQQAMSIANIGFRLFSHCRYKTSWLDHDGQDAQLHASQKTIYLEVVPNPRNITTYTTGRPYLINSVSVPVSISVSVSVASSSHFLFPVTSFVIASHICTTCCITALNPPFHLRASAPRLTAVGPARECNSTLLLTSTKESLEAC